MNLIVKCYQDANHTIFLMDASERISTLKVMQLISNEMDQIL